MYSYEEHPEPNLAITNYGIDAGYDITKILWDDLFPVVADPAEIERVKYGRKFKTGDWVTFDHGEYPEYISREPWQITHWSFQYNSKTGCPQGRIHKNPGMAHDENCLRYAHQDEIDYYLSGLPWIYNKEEGKYEKIEIFEGRHFQDWIHF